MRRSPPPRAAFNRVSSRACAAACGVPATCEVPARDGGSRGARTVMSPRRAQRRAELRCATSRRFSGMASSQASRSPSLVSPATVALSCSRRGPTCKKQVASNQGDLWGSQQEDGWRDKLEGVCMACSPVIRAAVLSPGLPGHSISVPAPPAPAGGAQRGCRATSSSPPIQC